MKTIALKTLLSGCVLLFPGNCVLGQTMNDVIPPSPTVASLGKFGGVPVGLYTGIPNVNIPIYNIQAGSLELSVSLSYYAGGVKVEEVASPVGLGWSLNAGGIIGKSIRGLADELGWYPQTATSTVEYIMLHGTTTEQNQFIDDVRWGYKDGEPDLYYYNFAGYTGKFFIDQVTGEGHSIPLKNLIIHKNPQWEIVGEDGTIYTFAREESVSSSNCSEGEDVINTTGWFLTNIKSSDGKDEINFTYEWAYYTFTTLVGETKYISTDGTSGCMENQSCQGTHNFRTHRLLQIDFPNGYMKFNYNNFRCDLVDDKRLDEIEIHAADGSLLKKFIFAYDYFGDNSDGLNRFTEDRKRLKLISITEESATDSKPPYNFYYNETTPLPSRLSYAQDHWGYFNGKVNNPGLVATFVKVLSTGATVIEKGADRRTDPVKAQACVLAKIVYPTGGETLFTYESNTVSDDHVEPQTDERTLYLAASNYRVADLPAPYESATELVVPEEGAQVEYSVSGLDSPPWQGCDVVHCYVIKDNDPTPFRQVDSGLNQGVEPWPAGTYKLRLVTECGVDAIANFSVTIVATIPVMETLDTRPVGGLRILQIEDKPASGAPSVIKRYKYHQENDVNKSSGVLINFPEYGYDLHVHKVVKEPCDATGIITTDLQCQYVVRTSQSNYPLATTQGSFVGYANVFEDNVSNGESLFTYNVYPDMQSPYPFAPVENFDWRRGFMANKRDFIKQGNQLTKVREVFNLPSAGTESRIYGLKTGCTSLMKYNCAADLWTDPCDGAVHEYYPVITEPFEMGQSREIVFEAADQAKYVENKVDYTYSPQHLQLSEIKTATSKSNEVVSEEVITKRKYPDDFSFTGSPSGDEALGIKKLQDLHIVNEVIEEYIMKQNTGISNGVSNQRVVSGFLKTYRPDNPYPDQILQLHLDAPVPLTNFAAGASISANAFQIPSLYKSVVSFLNYDDKGNVATQRKNDDVSTSYLWGYNKTYPISEAINVSNINDIAYSSFEEDSKGNWSYSAPGSASPDNYVPSGSKCYELSGGNSVSKNLLAYATTYVLSYTYRNGSSISVTGAVPTNVSTYPQPNGWSFLTCKVTGTSSLSISGSGFLDELRLYPVDARMFTYTHDPLIGVTSMTDSNNLTTYYKYDSFGRLKLVMDAEGNTVKSYSYHYKHH